MFNPSNVLVLISTLTAGSAASAAVQVFKNPDCAVNQSCSLKEFSLSHEDYRVVAGGGENFGTRAFALYQTAGIESLEDYAFVQFIRGCVFSSCRSADGSVRRELHYVRPSFGGLVPYHHAEWMVDSDDVDPMYNSTDEAGKSRHDIYRWNRVAGSFANPTQVFYGQGAPARPELYVSDRPGVAFHLPETGCAKNLSLEFRMCLYKSAEIPRVSTATRLDFAKPIHCFDWSSSFVYDHVRGRFDRPAGIDSICR